MKSSPNSVSASTAETESGSELNGLISIHFIEAQLKHVVVEVEARSNQIFAPNAIGRKSCDVLWMHVNKPFRLSGSEAGNRV